MVNRLIRPGSEFYIHRQWFDKTAMDELLNTDYRIAAKDRLYRCLDRILEHKEDLCKHLKSRWEDMFGIALIPKINLAPLPSQRSRYLV